MTSPSWNWQNERGGGLAVGVYVDDDNVIVWRRMTRHVRHEWKYPEPDSHRAFDNMIMDWCAQGPIGDAPGNWYKSNYDPDGVYGEPIRYRWRHVDRRGQWVETISMKEPVTWNK